jgi:hypothetical protein
VREHREEGETASTSRMSEEGGEVGTVVDAGEDLVAELIEAQDWNVAEPDTLAVTERE